MLLPQLQTANMMLRRIIWMLSGAMCREHLNMNSNGHILTGTTMMLRRKNGGALLKKD